MNEAARAVSERFGADLVGGMRSALDDLADNFAVAGAQGPQAYASQMIVDHPDLDPTTLTADAILAVGQFLATLFP